MKRFIQENSYSLLTIIFFVFFLEILVRFGYISAFILPTPSKIFIVWWTEKNLIFKHLFVTSGEAIGGFFLGSITAIIFASVFSRYPVFEKAVLPLAILFQTIPIVVISPILIVSFGNGMSPKIVVSALIAFFPVLVNMTKGLKEVDPTLLDLFTIFNADWVQILFKLRFPSSLPLLFSALRIASANCFIGAIIGEWISADSGIGYWILIKMYQNKIESMYAGVISSSLAAMALFSFVALTEYFLMPWERKIQSKGS